MSQKSLLTAMDEPYAKGRSGGRGATLAGPRANEIQTATYLHGDPQEVVAAAFSCHLCLTRADYVVVSVDEAAAIAICHSCQAETDIELTGEQVVRLAADPPPGLRVKLVW